MGHPDPRRGVSKGLHARGRAGALGTKRRPLRAEHPQGTERAPHPGPRARTAARGAIPLAAEMLLKRIWAGLSRSW